MTLLSSTALDAQTEPLVLVRMSAIGDTILAARTHGWARQKGYAPILVTNAGHASLVQCMPLLSGACLVADSGLKFLARDLQTMRLIDVTEQEFFNRFRMSSLQQLSQKKINLIDLQATRRSRRAIEQLELLASKAEISFRKQAVRKLTFWRIVLVIWSFLARTQWVGRTPPQWLQKNLKPVHQLQKEMIESLPHAEGILNASAKPAETMVQAGTSAVLTAPQLSGEGADEKQKSTAHVVLLLGSSFRLKSWPSEHFRSLIELLLAKTELKVVLCGGAEDARVGDYLAFLNPLRIENLAGRTSLAETLAWIRDAAYVVTGDSFASHAADLLGTPASVLFGSTHPLLGFAPEGSHTFVHHSQLSCSPCSRHGQGECRFKNLRCLTSIKPEEVFSKIEHALARKRQSDDTPSTLS